MPSVMLAMTNGRSTSGNGITSKDLLRKNSNGSAGRPYPREEITKHRQHRKVNEIDDVKRSSSANGHIDIGNVETIRLRLRKGRTGKNRNGAIFDSSTFSPNVNNNGPVKAFPMNKNEPLISPQNQNKNKSDSGNVSRSSSNSASSSSSTTNGKRNIHIRPPLHRINGHTNMKPHQPLQSASSVNNPQNLFVIRPNSDPIQDKGDVRTPGRSRSNVTPASWSKVTSASSEDTGEERDISFVKFAERQLPPGAQELQRDFFVPGSKCYFQRKANLPLLKSTDASILKRRSSVSHSKKNNIIVNGQRKVQNGARESGEDGTVTRLRSRSNASEIFFQPDMEIIHSCWSVVLAFMGDERPLGHKHHGSRFIGSIVASKRKYFRSSKRLWRKSSTGALGSRSNKYSPSSSHGKGDGKRPISMINYMSSSSASSASETSVKKNYSNNDNKTMGLTVLEKVQFLTNVGIKLPYLRDEIYCIIIKQLVTNPSPRSTGLGWILLSLVIGCFPPSEKITSFIQLFLENNAHDWSLYCQSRLKRSIKKGPRNNPPCSLEIQASRSREPITLPVICSDQSIQTMASDSMTTCQEIVQSMAEKNRLQDSFGFSLFLSIGEKVLKLGTGPFPIMDAISQAEKCHSSVTGKCAWRLHYRRDIFSPRDLYQASVDHMSSLLTFSQICGGVRSGEYVCCKASDLALLVAHQYCVKHGIENIDNRKITALCDATLPYEVYKLDKKNWAYMVVKTLRALAKETNSTVNPIDIMGQVIRFAMLNFTPHFVRSYNITTFTTVGAVCTYTSDLTLHVSHKEVTVKQGAKAEISSPVHTDKTEVVTVPSVLFETPVRDIKRVKLDTNNSNSGTTLTISLHVGGSYDVTSAHGPEIYSILFRYIRDISTGANKESQA